MSANPSLDPRAGADAPLHGVTLLLAVLMLAGANFVAVLNMTIANVAVPSITGALGAATSQGTWVITSYAVGEAITVPLTGWLAARFGPVKVFVAALLAFALFSVACGLSQSLGLLVAARALQGLSGGPLMPLSQTLMLRVFPKDKAGAAIGIWAMTTLVAPVVGPILGGKLCDDYMWNWCFLANVPFAVMFGVYGWKLLGRYQAVGERRRMDIVGLGVLVIFVAALQIMLDEGKNLDWFSSAEIVALAVIAVIGLAFFVIWELHEEYPIVDLTVFRHIGFTFSTLSLSLTYAAFFGAAVLTPLWLQSFMGYTATDAGLATAWTGFTSIFVMPSIAASKRDPRQIVSVGGLLLGGVMLWRAVATTDMGFWDIAIPLMAFGLFLPATLLPTNTLGMASVEQREMDSAAGLMNFLRTLGGAFATSLVTTVWDSQITRNHAELVGLVDADQSVLQGLIDAGTPAQTALHIVDYLVVSQSVMLSTNQVMIALAAMFVVAGAIIWFAPKPSRAVEPGVSGH